MALKLRLQFSLRLLLVVMVLCGIGLGVYARTRSRANQQREIIAELKRSGGHIRYDFECWSESPWYATQRWLEPRTGPDFVGNVLILNFDHRGTEPTWLDALRNAIQLQSIEYVSLPRPDMSSEQVRCVAQFSALKQLGLHDARNMPDLSPLAACLQLNRLSLHSCRQVTAEKLKGLQRLPNLKLFDVCCTDAGDDVAAELAQFVALEEVHVEFSGITHDGLVALAESKSLRIVHLSREQVANGIVTLAPAITFDVK